MAKIDRWPPIRWTWEEIRKLIEDLLSRDYYRDFPDRKLAAMDYWLAQFLAVRADVQADRAIKTEGEPSEGTSPQTKKRG